MLLTILLVAQVGCEWVEISQQHYRKPVRLTHNHPIISTVDKVTEDAIDETKVNNRIYMNNTLSEYNWNNAVQRTPNTGNIRKVQLVGSNVKSNSIQNIKRPSEFNNHGTVEVGNERFEEESNFGTIQKVPNIGSVKRDQLENSPVKSPSLKIKAVTENIFNSKKGITNDFKSYGQNHDVIEKPIPQVKKEIHSIHPNENAFSKITERVPIFPTISKYNKTAAEEENRFYTATYLPKEGAFNKQENIIKSPNIEKVTVLKAGNTESDKNYSKYGSHRPITKISESITKEELITKHELENINNDAAVGSIKTSKNHVDAKTDADEVNADKTLPNTKVPNAMENVVKLMKVVADIISSNTRRNFNSKMRYLHELRDTILANIEERIDEAWPNDVNAAGSRRRSRSAYVAARGHVEFPSSEGALMSISFLTFAVFLIKLVLQVIHTYKNKAMMVAPLVVAAAGRTASKG